MVCCNLAPSRGTSYVCEVSKNRDGVEGGATTRPTRGTESGLLPLRLDACMLGPLEAQQLAAGRRAARLRGVK